MVSIPPCKSVGNANPDIAGIGILVAFIAQALISLVLSFWSHFLSSRILQVLHTNRTRHDTTVTAFDFIIYSPYSLPERLRFCYQSWKQSSAARRLGMLREKHKHTSKKLEIVNRILVYSSDAQTLNGIALLISGLAASKSLDLYHLHIIYDTVNFTGVSNCAAIFNSISASPDACSKRTFRYLTIALFALIFLAYSIVFGIRLNQWDPERPGACYNTAATALTNKPHPREDLIYLGVTCTFFYSALPGAIHNPELKLLMKFIEKRSHRALFSSVAIDAAGLDDFEQRVEDRSWSVLALSMLQFPLHLYFVIALRASNQGLLEGGRGGENSWGFGQVVAIVMLGGTVLKGCKGVKEYWTWKRKFERSNAGQPAPETAATQP